MYLSNIPNFIFRRPRLRAKLRGHTGSVVSLAFSRTGRLLASGGVDGVKVWDLKSMEEIEVPQQPFYERGQVSCICWITRQNDISETLCYGNALGFLVFLQHSPAEGCFKVVFSARLALGGEILSMTAHISPSFARIATGSRDKCIQVWDFDSSTCELKTVYSRRHGAERDIVPKALVFDNNPDKDVFAFGLYDGGMYRCSGVDGSIISRDQLGPNIGNAAMDTERGLIVVDNIATGFDLYKVVKGDKKFVRTLEVGKPSKTYAKSVVFGNGSRAVITGSDHGKVYIFDRASGSLLKKMTHSKNGGVETICVHDEHEGSVLIASASVRDKFGSTPNHILVWKWTPKASRENSQWSVALIVEWTFKTIIVCAAVAFAVECALKFHGDRDQIQVADSMVPPMTTMTDQALQEYIKEQVAKNMFEKYIQSMNFPENHRSATVMVSTGVIGNYNPLEENGGSNAVASQAKLRDSDHELSTLRIETDDISVETEHPKYQDL